MGVGTSAKSGRKQHAGMFKKGQSGNPKGRPAGSKTTSTLIAEQLIDGQAEAIVQKIFSMAMRGDALMLRWLGDRIVAPRRERRTKFELPPVKTVEDIVAATEAICVAVSDGRLSASEAGDLSAALDRRLSALAAADIEREVKEVAARLTKARNEL
jgi:hypothetical protein